MKVTNRSVESISWQDYRGFSTGLVVFYNSDPVSEMPIREVPEEINSPVAPEPNYETATYGMYGCVRSKVRQMFCKSKSRYVFFMTKYAGTNEEYRDRIVVTGYYRIAWIADGKKFHVRYLKEYECLDYTSCMALRADEAHFVALDDAFLVDDEVQQEWGYTSRITRQTRIALEEDAAIKLVTWLGSRPNALDDYIEETTRLQPHDPDDESPEIDEEK